MQTVTFPGIGLTITLNKIAFKIGNLGIHWYALLIVFSFLIAIFFLYKNSGKFGAKTEDITDLILYLIPISIASARIYYCIFKADYYFKNPLQIFNLRTGGLAIYGGIIGGAITCYIFCKKRKIKPLSLFDYIAPYLALGQAIGRWGNFINVEAYGIETNLPWRMGILENGTYKEVHPTFLYESIADLIIFLILIYLNSEKSKQKYKFTGKTTYIYFILYSLARSFIEGIRSDSLMLYNIKISQILSLAIFVVFSMLLSKKVILNRKINRNTEK